MSSWRMWIRAAADVSVDGNSLTVTLPDGRKQRILVTETEETIEFSSTVVGRQTLADIPDGALRAWRRNRSTHLVGFRVDTKHRLVASAWVPRAGLTEAEFIVYVRRVAREADLFEHQLTGVDRE